MADFCKECSEELFGLDGRDLATLAAIGEVVPALCEGCGPTLVDHEGSCRFHKQAGGTQEKCLEASKGLLHTMGGA